MYSFCLQASSETFSIWFPNSILVWYAQRFVVDFPFFSLCLSFSKENYIPSNNIFFSCHKIRSPFIYLHLHLGVVVIFFVARCHKTKRMQFCLINFKNNIFYVYFHLRLTAFYFYYYSNETIRSVQHDACMSIINSAIHHIKRGV